MQRGEAFAHVGGAIRIACQITLPGLPQGLQLGTDVLLESCRVRRRRGPARRYKRVEPVQPLDVPQPLGERRRACDRVEQLAQHGLVVRLRAGGQVAEVEVDLVPKRARLREACRLRRIE